MNQSKIPEKQQKLLNFISEFKNQNLRTPTVAEMAGHMGTSECAVWQKINSLKRRKQYDI